MPIHLKKMSTKKIFLALIGVMMAQPINAMKTTSTLGYTEKIDLGEQLVLAAEEGNDNRIQELLARGIDINYSSNTKGWPALKAAVNRGNLATVQMLIQAGADLEATSCCFNETALMQCAKFGNYPEILKFLLQFGANTETNKFGCSALTEAIESGSSSSFAKKLATSKILLHHITQLTQPEKESVKNWLLLTKKLKPELGIRIPKAIQKLVAQFLYQSLAQDILKKVIAAGAPRALRHAKHYDQTHWAPFVQLLENHMNLEFLEELVRKQMELPKRHA